MYSRILTFTLFLGIAVAVDAEPTATLVLKPNTDAPSTLYIAGATGSDADSANEKTISSFILKTAPGKIFLHANASENPLGPMSANIRSVTEISSTNLRSDENGVGGEQLIVLGDVLPVEISDAESLSTFLASGLGPRYVPALGSGKLKSFLLADVNGCDFTSDQLDDNPDGQCDHYELETISNHIAAAARENIVPNLLYDLNGDSTVDSQDIHLFRAQGALKHGFFENGDLIPVRYLVGDADLDEQETVDGKRELKVGFSDYLIVSKNFGRTGDATWIDGDFDGDFAVKFEDFLALSANFGKTLTANPVEPAAAANVPEPQQNAPVVFMCVLGFFLRRIWRTKSE